MSCSLRSGGDVLQTIVWEADAVDDRTGIALQGVTPGGATTLSVTCNPGAGNTGLAYNRSLIAIPVG